jgi:formylglycine-generating enzyme required for sulfatase activity
VRKPEAQNQGFKSRKKIGWLGCQVGQNECMRRGVISLYLEARLFFFYGSCFSLYVLCILFPAEASTPFENILIVENWKRISRKGASRLIQLLTETLLNIFSHVWSNCVDRALRSLFSCHRSKVKAVPSLRIIVFATTLFLLMGSSYLFANNVAIENVEVVEHDDSADTIEIEFDLSWSNAWRDSINQDAVWVFAKYCLSSCTSNGTWSHATLKTPGTNPSGFADGTKQSGSNFVALDIVVPTDKMGAFLQPASSGSGTVDFHDVQIVWDYGQDGVTDAQAEDGTNTYVRVYGIEMVYIPEGGFKAGDDSAGTNGEFEYRSSDSSLAAPISNEEEISFDDSTDIKTKSLSTKWYYNTDGTADDDASGTVFQVSESFPKGYQAFYLMKYEVSQGQYRDFLKTLTQAQQDTRVASTLTDENDANTYVMVAESQATVASRQSVKAGSNPADGDPYSFTVDFDDDDSGDETTDGEWIAMNYLSWMDLLAYGDWTALRPFTELEYEKAARGPISAVSSESAWGSVTITSAATLSNSGLTNEGVTETGTGLTNYNNVLGGPLRVGFAATGSTTTRLAAAAGYYGNLDLSGNVWERTVTLGNATGRGFSGTHGDGELTTAGNATNPDWPGFSSGNGVNGATGGGFRGGAWDETTATNLDTSNRTVAGDDDSTRRSDSGGRLARTA